MVVSVVVSVLVSVLVCCDRYQFKSSNLVEACDRDAVGAEADCSLAHCITVKAAGHPHNPTTTLTPTTTAAGHIHIHAFTITHYTLRYSTHTHTRTHTHNTHTHHTRACPPLPSACPPLPSAAHLLPRIGWSVETAAPQLLVEPWVVEVVGGESKGGAVFYDRITQHVEAERALVRSVDADLP